MIILIEWEIQFFARFIAFVLYPIFIIPSDSLYLTVLNFNQENLIRGEHE